MGMWVILIGDENFDLDIIKSMSFDGAKDIRSFNNQIDVYYDGQRPIQRYDGEHLHLIYDDDYVSFQEDDGADLPPEEIAELPFINPRFIIMKYSNAELMRKIVGSGDFPKNIFIDCDGVNLGLEKIIDKSRLIDCNC